MQDDTLYCNSWPKSSNYGCVTQTDGGLTVGDAWELLDNKTFGTSECQYLCLQHASSDGCCYVNGTQGCYWKGETRAEIGSYGFAITCAGTMSSECYLIFSIIIK